MTTVRVFRRGDRIERVTAKGHTGYAEHGSDIVCAAISTLLETALIGLKQVARVRAESERDEDTGYLEFRIPDERGERERAAQVILETMLAGIADLAKSQGRYIKLEVKEL